MTTGPPVSLWPRTQRCGLSHGWEGAAWVSLQCLKERPASSRGRGFARALDRRLRQVPFNGYNHSSLFSGSSARPLVGVLAARRDPEFKALLPGLMRDWRASLERCRETDLMFGAAGALLACCEIESAVPGSAQIDIVERLKAAAQAAASAELTRLSRKQPVALGLAHGLAGYLLALEAAQTVFGRSLSASRRAALIDALAAERREGQGGTAVWPDQSSGENFYIHGWCHGGPGIGLALLTGFALTGQKAYWQLARMALEGAARISNEAETFCCGSTGRAQILIEAYRVTGDHGWLKKAFAVADEKRLGVRPKQVHRAIRDGVFVEVPVGQLIRTFHKGRLGRLYLERRLADPTLPLPGLGPLSCSA